MLAKGFAAQKKGDDAKPRIKGFLCVRVSHAREEAQSRC